MKRSTNEELKSSAGLKAKQGKPFPTKKGFKSFLHTSNNNRAVPVLHLLNSVRKNPGVYSCAIDSFIEMF